MKFNSKEFKQLRKVWYEKLKQEGFEDIEKNDFELRHPTRALPRDAESIAIYYKKARALLEQFPFESKRNKVIWFLHSDGVEGSEIAHLLNTSTSTVSRVIEEYQKVIL